MLSQGQFVTPPSSDVIAPKPAQSSRNAQIPDPGIPAIQQPRCVPHQGLHWPQLPGIGRAGDDQPRTLRDPLHRYDENNKGHKCKRVSERGSFSLSRQCPALHSLHSHVPPLSRAPPRDWQNEPAPEQLLDRLPHRSSEHRSECSPSICPLHERRMGIWKAERLQGHSEIIFEVKLLIYLKPIV